MVCSDTWFRAFARSEVDVIATEISHVNGEPRSLSPVMSSSLLRAVLDLSWPVKAVSLLLKSCELSSCLRLSVSVAVRLFETAHTSSQRSLLLSDRVVLRPVDIAQISSWNCSVLSHIISAICTSCAHRYLWCPLGYLTLPHW